MLGYWETLPREHPPQIPPAQPPSPSPLGPRGCLSPKDVTVCRTCCGIAPPLPSSDPEGRLRKARRVHILKGEIGEFQGK